MAELDCGNNNLSPELYLRGTLGLDGNGNCAFRIVPVLDANLPLQSCSLNNLSALELLKMLIEVDGNGNLGIRVIEGVDSGNQCIDCGNTYNSFEELIANAVIGLATDGRPALRLIS